MWLLLVIILVVLGVAAVYPNIGMGGGFLHVPALIYLAGLEKSSAVPISLTLVLAGALAALPGHYKLGYVDPRLAAYLSVGAVLGAVCGTLINLSMSQWLFEWLFAITILIVSIKMLYDLLNSKGPEVADDRRMCTPWISASVGLAVLAGILSSTFGIGGGLVFVPTMIYLLCRETKLAAGTSSLIIVPTSIVGLTTYYLTGADQFDPNLSIYVLILVPVALIGAYTGSVFFAEKLTGVHVKAIFITVSLIVAISMIAMNLM